MVNVALPSSCACVVLTNIYVPLLLIAHLYWCNGCDVFVYGCAVVRFEQVRQFSRNLLVFVIRVIKKKSSRRIITQQFHYNSRQTMLVRQRSARNAISWRLELAWGKRSLVCWDCG